MEKAEEEGFKIGKLEDYLKYCESLLQLNLDRNAVCLKNSMAYSRSIDYEDVNLQTAVDIFNRAERGLLREDQKKLEDFMFHWLIKKSIEYEALGKMFPNVYLDLVWLPQISRETAVRTFDEMLDCVPYSKICWGADCAVIEESVGSLEYAKGVIAEVLTKRIKRGLMTEELAYDIVDGIFRENAIKLFKLEQKLGIKSIFGD